MQKNVYLGSIFIPEKYVFRVCFESPFTRMISSLKYKWPGSLSHFKFIHLLYLLVTACYKVILSFLYRPSYDNRDSHYYWGKVVYSLCRLSSAGSSSVIRFSATKHTRDDLYMIWKEQCCRQNNKTKILQSDNISVVLITVSTIWQPETYNGTDMLTPNSSLHTLGLKTCGATRNPEFPRTGPDRTGPKPVRGRGIFLRIFSGRVESGNFISGRFGSGNFISGRSGSGCF